MAPISESKFKIWRENDLNFGAKIVHGWDVDDVVEVDEEEEEESKSQQDRECFPEDGQPAKDTRYLKKKLDTLAIGAL